MFIDLQHFTCLAHALHRVAETVRKIYPKVNEFVSKYEKSFEKIF
jgi:hypothetical protein